MKRQLPPLNALRAFEAAARLGRMNAAALELAVTPGAISRQVQQLEDCLNLQLFEGSKNRPQLTPAAKLLLPAISTALDQIEAAVKSVTNAKRGVLDVACYSTFMAKWLIPRLFDFNVRYPDIEIRLQTTAHADDTIHARVDLVIAVERAMPDAPGVLPLFAERLGPVLAPDLARKIELHKPEDLQGRTLLQSKGRTSAWSTWATAVGCATPQGPGQLFDHYYFALEAAVAGLGIAVAPRHLVAEEVRTGRLVAPFGFCPSNMHYVAKRSAQRNPRLDLFCAWLLEQATQVDSGQGP